MNIDGDIVRSRLNVCVDDAWQAEINGDTGPADPTDYVQLRSRLLAARERLPMVYRSKVYTPYDTALDQMGRDGFVDILLRDPTREGLGGVLMDIAHAILQNGERFEDKATDAFQEVVADLYDGFLSAEDRRGVNPPDRGVVPPMVKWGQPGFGPYTVTGAATENFGVGAAIVSLPPANARRGLVGWAALAHEAAGHDILQADIGMTDEISVAILFALTQQGNPLATYWANRIDETAADVLGILNMGPAAGIGLLAYFRAVEKAKTGTAALANESHPDDFHPVDILRGYLAAETVRSLNFSNAGAWSAIIEAETDRDFRKLKVGIAQVDNAPLETNRKIAKDSAKLVAHAITNTQLPSLERHRLADIQNWDDDDDVIVEDLIRVLLSTNPLPQRIEAGIYAAHAVAAGVVAALTSNVGIDIIFSRVVTLLKQMHDSNPSWGPMFITSRGDLARHFARRRGTGTPPIQIALPREEMRTQASGRAAKNVTLLSHSEQRKRK